MSIKKTMLIFTALTMISTPTQSNVETDRIKIKILGSEHVVEPEKQSVDLVKSKKDTPPTMNFQAESNKDTLSTMNFQEWKTREFQEITPSIIPYEEYVTRKWMQDDRKSLKEIRNERVEKMQGQLTVQDLPGAARSVIEFLDSNPYKIISKIIDKKGEEGIKARAKQNKARAEQNKEAQTDISKWSKMVDELFELLKFAHYDSKLPEIHHGVYDYIHRSLSFCTPAESEQRFKILNPGFEEAAFACYEFSKTKKDIEKERQDIEKERQDIENEIKILIKNQQINQC